MENETQIYIAIATGIATGTCSGGLLKPLPILRQLAPGTDTGIDTAIAIAIVTAIDTKTCSPKWVAENASGLGGQY